MTGAGNVGANGLRCMARVGVSGVETEATAVKTGSELKVC